jgi:hypothetical protein
MNTILLSGLLAVAACASVPPGPQSMTFFVTSAGSGKGADLGGLAGADAHCQALAKAAGAGQREWRAYLSTQAPGLRDANFVNARDRIGSGPWQNVKGVVIANNVDELHSPASKLTKETALTEKGAVVNGTVDKPNQHDMLTGSQLDGRAFTDAADHTCQNWTSNAAGTAQLGHHDRMGGGGNSWNSQHASKGCSQENLVATGGAGLFYCFATD